MTITDWLGPTLGFIATVSATLVGLYQWRKSDKQRRQTKYLTRRAEVMEALVSRLQQVQLLSRSRTVGRKELGDQIEGLNRFLIENRLWLEVADGDLAKSYLGALLGIHEEMRRGSAAFGLSIGTRPDIFDENPLAANYFADLGRAEKLLVARTRKAMRK